MIKQMNAKQKLVGGVAVVAVALGVTYAVVSSSGKKQAMAYYEDFKERYFLEDVLSEGDISYSALSGNLTVADPEVRVAAVQTNGAQQFMRSMAGVMASMRGMDMQEGLGNWAEYQMNALESRYVTGVFLKADALKLSHSGDSKDGEIHVQLLGMQMADPYIAAQGQDIVRVADVSDEIQPTAELTANGRASQAKMPWGVNLAARQPVTGAFLVNSTGQFGTRIDLDLTLQRSSDGEGVMTFVVTHRNDGSKVGEIVRKATLHSMPELDDVQAQFKAALGGQIVAAFSPPSGLAMFSEAVSELARKAKVERYELSYSGFKPVRTAFEAFQHTTPNAKFADFCQAVGFSSWSSDFGTKAKQHSDSECAIAQKLAAGDDFEETYTFKEGKSLYAALFVSKAYELETN